MVSANMVTKLPAKVAKLRDAQIIAGRTLLIGLDINSLKVFPMFF